MRRVIITGALLLMAACGSSTAVPPAAAGFPGSTNATAPSVVQATVNFVDTRGRRIDVDVSTVDRVSKPASGQSIYYDPHTRVVLQGDGIAAADLERGDRIAVQGQDDHGKYLADTIAVTRGVRTGS